MRIEASLSLSLSLSPPSPQALVDISANEGWLGVALKVMQLIQMCVQGRWLSNSSLLTLPHFDDLIIATLNSVFARGSKQLPWQSGVKEIATLPELLIVCEYNRNFVDFALRNSLNKERLSQVRILIFFARWS